MNKYMNYYLLTLVSSLPLREQHIIKVKQMIGSHNKYFTLPEHASESRKKKSILQSTMSKHNYFVKK